MRETGARDSTFGNIEARVISNLRSPIIIIMVYIYIYIYIIGSSARGQKDAFSVAKRYEKRTHFSV